MREGQGTPQNRDNNGREAAGLAPSVGQHAKSQPFDELIQAALFLACRQINAGRYIGESGPFTTFVCTECLRGHSVNGNCDIDASGIPHQVSCGTGRVVELALECRELRQKAASDGTRMRELDDAACGDSLYEPTLDRHLLCTLKRGHVNNHYDEIENLHWPLEAEEKTCA